MDVLDGPQSALAPAGPEAAEIARIAWLLFAGATAIFVLVLVLAAIALWRAPRWLGGRGTVVVGGFVFPLVVLSALLVDSLFSAPRRLASMTRSDLVVEIVGEQWWWRVEYLDERGGLDFATANELHVPVGAAVELRLTSADVLHSFWVPSLAGKLDMIPGRVTGTTFAATTPGIYRGQCAEYCGAQHALMAFYVVATSQAEYDAWLAQQVGNAAEPATPFLARGQELFVAAGCGSCHTVRGTPATGLFGPDLTRVGSRLSIAAGTYPVNVGTLAGWTSSAQHLKPGSLMPSFGNLQGEQLRAIAAYMESLK